MMSTNRGVRLLLILACLSAQGCAGVGGQRSVQKPAQPADQKDDLGELQRDLSLYAD